MGGGYGIMWNWPNVLTGIGTILMAIFVAITALYARRSWNKIIEKDQQREIKRFFRKFVKLEGPIYFNIFANKTIPNDKAKGRFFILFGLQDRIKLPYAIIKFLSNLGEALKKKEISVDDIYRYFKEYLFNKAKVLIFIRNFSFLFPGLPKNFIDNFNFLISEIGKKEKIEEYSDIVKESFNEISYDDFLGYMDKRGLKI